MQDGLDCMERMSVCDICCWKASGKVKLQMHERYCVDGWILPAVTMILLIGGGASPWARDVGPSQNSIRTASADCGPYEQACHDISTLGVMTSNFGILGFPDQTHPNPYMESCGHEEFVSLRHAQSDFLFMGALWVGAKVGGDTLVSVGHDGWQHEMELMPEVGLLTRSDDPTSPLYSADACAPLEIIAEYTDTLLRGECEEVSPNHLTPLPLSVTQVTRGWENVTDAGYVLVDHTVRNRGTATLEDTYFAWYLDGDVGPTPPDVFEARANCLDDIAGYGTFEGGGRSAGYGWIADFDGPDYQDPYHGDSGLVPQALAAALVWNSRGESYPLGFNWWISDVDPNADWGPGQPLPGGTNGTPDGDGNKYLIMNGWQNSTLDDSLLVDPESGLKRDPGQLSTLRGGAPIGAADTRFLASFGPVDLAPGEEFSFSYALAVARIYPGDDPAIRDFRALEATLERAQVRREELCNPLGVSGESPPSKRAGLTLHQNQPNPFNPHTTIRYEVAEETRARLAIYDVSGALVRTLHQGVFAAGHHASVWDGRSDAGAQVGSGVYFCRLSSDGVEFTRKLVLVQ